MFTDTLSARTALRRLLAGAALVTVAAIAGQGATLIANVALANVLGSTQFGAYSFLQSSLNNLSLIAQLSFGLLATKYLSEYSHRDPDRAGRMLGFGTVVTLLSGAAVAVVFSLVMSGLQDIEGLSGRDRLVGVGAICVAIPLAALSYFQVGVLQGLGQFRMQAVLSLWQAALAVALPVAGGLLAGVAGSAVGVLLFVVSRSAGNAAAIHRVSKGARLDVRPVAPPELPRLLWDFALPASLTGLTTAGSQWLAGLVLLAQPGGSHEFGLYAVGMLFRTVVVLVPAQIGTVALAHMTRHLADKDVRRYRQVSSMNVIVTSGIALTIGVVLALLVPWLLPVFGKSFVEAASLVYVILVGAALEAIGVAIYPRLPSQSRMWTSFLSVALPRDACFLIGFLLLVAGYLGTGLAIAYVISQFAGLVGVILATRGMGGHSNET